MEHSFDIEFAQVHGVAAAILYRHMQFWISKNRANRTNYHDGRTWTFNSIKAYKEQFPNLTEWEIRKALNHLLSRKIILKGNYNKRGADRTTWYAFIDEETALKGLPSHLRNTQMGNQAKKSNCVNHESNREILKSNCETHRPLPYQSNPNTPTEINNKVEKKPHEVLELDCKIAEAKKFLREQLSRIFPPLSKREIGTFTNIIKHFVSSAQADPLKISWFKDAAEWARVARIEGNKAGGKALFVQTVKERTGYGNNPKLLSDKSRKDSRTRASPRDLR
jgi:hypothetical protein